METATDTSWIEAGKAWPSPSGGSGHEIVQRDCAFAPHVQVAMAVGGVLAAPMVAVVVSEPLNPLASVTVTVTVYSSLEK